NWLTVPGTVSVCTGARPVPPSAWLVSTVRTPLLRNVVPRKVLLPARASSPGPSRMRSAGLSGRGEGSSMFAVQRHPGVRLGPDGGARYQGGGAGPQGIGRKDGVVERAGEGVV